MSKEKKKKLIQYIWISIGVILLDIGFYFFMDPSKIVLGGMMGLAILLEPFYTMIGEWFTPAIFLFIGNVVTLIIGGIILGKDFFYKTIYSSLFSPVIVFIFEQLFDPLFFLKNVSTETGFYLVSLAFGTLLCGLGLGLAIKNNGCTGGMDVIQRILSKVLHVPYSKTMYFTDGIIVLLSGFTFIGAFKFNIEIVMYGLIGIVLVSILIDKLILDLKPRRTFYIITRFPDAVKNTIYETVNRGVTIVDAKGGYTGEERKLLICTLERDEAYKLSEVLLDKHPETFSFSTGTKEIVGDYRHRNYDSKTIK